MDLSIVIVSWNVKEKLRTNLKALYQSEGNFKSEIFVVDNNSQDGSADMIRKEFPQVKLIANSENFGFSRANNQALRLASGRFILLLNPDMRVFENSLAQILTWAGNNEQATVSGCRLLNEKQEIVKQIRKFPRLLDQLLIVLKLPHLFPGLLNKYLCSRFNYDVPSRVDSIRGAFFLINRAAYQKISGQEVPYLDERYFIWFEEVDFCRQVYKLGGEVWYTPAAECLDYVGQSFKQVSRLKTQDYFRDSMLKYFKKWERPWKARVLAGAWRLVILLLK
jgi:hypothetical protein